MNNSNKIGNTIFDGLAKQMLLDFDQIKREIIHKGERGTQQEETLKEFLGRYLPKKYGVGRGEIINSQNQVSRQCDVVIYNALESPLLLIREGYQLFPVEAVLATIEVKSSFNHRSIAETIDNIASVRNIFEQVSAPSFCCFLHIKAIFVAKIEVKRQRNTLQAIVKIYYPRIFLI